MSERRGWDVSEGPGVTALGLAAARSVESSRADRLIADPFARGLFEAAGAALPMLVEWPEPGSPVSDTQALHLHGSRYIGLRSRFYDDTLLTAIHAGAVQAVLLGAGLDTRAFRLELPADFAVFEVDQARVLEFKDATLAELGAAPRCRRIPLGLDLRDDWPAALRAHSFDPRAPTVWLAEGVLPYLPGAAQRELLERIDALSGPGSSLALDRIVGDPRAGDRLRDLSTRSGIEMDRLVAGGPEADLGGFLAANGWQVAQEPTRSLADRHERDLADPFAGDGAPGAAAEPPWLDTVFLSAARPSSPGSG